MARVMKRAEAGDIEAWGFNQDATRRVPAPRPSAGDTPPPPPPVEVPPALLEEARRAAAEEGRREGHAAGLEQARAEVAARLARVDAIITTLATPLADLDRRTAVALTRTAAAIGERLAGRALTEDPQVMADLVERAIGLLPADAAEVVVHLHPTDFDAMRTLVDAGEDAHWTLAKDEGLEPGDCRITSAGSSIDATLATRTARLLDALMVELGLETDPDATAGSAGGASPAAASTEAPGT